MDWEECYCQCVVKKKEMEGQGKSAASCMGSIGPYPIAIQWIGVKMNLVESKQTIKY